MGVGGSLLARSPSGRCRRGRFPGRRPAGRRCDRRVLWARDGGRPPRPPRSGGRWRARDMRVAARDGAQPVRRHMAPPGHHVMRAEAVVRYDPEWERDAKVFGDSALELLVEFVELGEVVLRREYTPLDIEAKLTTMKRGSIKHGAYSPLQMGYLRPNDMCSASTTPIPGLF